jgi:hypothetical protein
MVVENEHKFKYQSNSETTDNNRNGRKKICIDSKLIFIEVYYYTVKRIIKHFTLILTWHVCNVKYLNIQSDDLWHQK